MIIFVAFVVLTALTLRLRKKNRGLGHAGLLLFGAYAFSLLGALCMVLVEGRTATLDATLFFLTVLLLFILPLASVQPAKLANCPPPEWKPIYNAYAWMVVVITIFATATTLPAAARLLLSGQLGEVRDALYRGGSGATSDISFPSLAASGLWPVALALFFYALLAGRPLPLLVGLGVGSLSGATSSLVVAGRSGLVYFGMQVTLMIALVWPLIRFYRPQLRSLITAGGIASFGGIGLLTVAIAFMRNIGNTGTFSVISNNPLVNTLYSLVIYAGSSIINFQEFWFIYDDFGTDLMGQKCFPVFCGILERLNVIGDYEANEFLTVYKPFYDAYNLEHAVFNGFQRELMMDFGRWGTLGGSVVWATAAWLARRRFERRLDWFSLSSMAFFASLPLQGIFFLSYAEIQGNVALAAMVGTMAFFWVTGRSTDRPRARAPVVSR